jgi:hypothetical protein
MGTGTEVKSIPKVRQVYYTTYAALPTIGISIGDLGYATDRLVFYRWDGAAWQPITIHSSSGTAAAIPAAANLPNGSLYYETNTTLLKQVQAGAWVSITVSVPSGAIIMWSGTIANIPSGWHICDGNAGTPNLLAKFVQGVATAATNPGATGGNVSHTHSITRSADMTSGTALVDNVAVTDSADGRPPYYDVAFIMKL